jgi:ketosteroid isomerase-like protein
MPAPVAQKRQPQEPPPTVATKTEPAPVPTIKNPPPAPDPAATEWGKVSASHDPNVLGDFIRKFPNTPQAAEASRKLDQLRSDAARIASEKASADLAATRSAIEQTLSRYAQAYRNRDANAITQVWPGLNRQDLKKIQESFKAAKSVDMNLRPEAQPEINGEVAQVVCLRSLQFTFPQGVQKPLQDRVIIHMRKQNGLWVIEKVQ